jgi:LuxR family quorum sensing-dependent transcriptional regulator
VNAISDATTLEHFTEVFAGAVRPFGITGFAIGRIPALGMAGRLFSVRWPGWIEHYAVNGFVREDIAIEETLRSLEPFTWADLRKRRPGEGTRVFEECHSFGWSDGFVVPVDGPDRQRGLVSLAAPSPLSPLNGAKRETLVALSLSAYLKAWTLATDQPGAPLRLSAREQEAIAHVAKGRDDTDIARLMSISPTTAHAHVERAKKRLGASTRAQAVALAMASKLI